MRRLSSSQWDAARRRRQAEEDRRYREATRATCTTCHQPVFKLPYRLSNGQRWSSCRCVREAYEEAE